MLESRYRILSKLGAGGMSTVYLAEDTRLKGKLWAIKWIENSGLSPLSALAEAEMLVRLNHPQLPHIVDYFEYGAANAVCVVMDYIEGETLQLLFERKKRSLPILQLISYALQICDLLQYLHEQKPEPIVYRDLKPSNIMVEAGGTLRLIDFGIARGFKAGQDGDTVNIGTVGFAAPELYSNAQSDPRSDIYSLGAMLYYLLSGGHFYYLLPKPLYAFNTSVPLHFQRVIERMLGTRPEDRFQSAKEIKDQLLLVQSEFGFTSEFELNLQLREKRLAHVEHRLIAIGSLYAGAGATFVSISAARALHTAGIPHAFVEHPCGNPDLYMLLFGEKNAPKPYKFPCHRIHEDMESNAVQAMEKYESYWRDGHTHWVPVPPDGDAMKWRPEDAFKLLYWVKSPVVIWDLSSHWDDEASSALCKSADEIWIVFDTSPHKLNRPASRERIRHLAHLYGSKLKWIANRDVPLSGRSHWLQSIPQPPSCAIPEIPYERVLQATWNGSILQDDDDIKGLMMQALHNMLQGIAPQHWNEALKSQQLPKRKKRLSFGWR